jgi:predicted transcriptional regulator
MARSFTDQLKQAIRESGMSRYALSVKTGIAQSTLCKFLKGERGMSLESVDKLMDTLGLEVKSRRRRKDGCSWRLSTGRPDARNI